MFSVNTNSPTLRIGERNAEAAKAKLKELNIKLVAEDTGDKYGRTVEFFPATGEYHIRAIGREGKII